MSAIDHGHGPHGGHFPQGGRFPPGGPVPPPVPKLTALAWAMLAAYLAGLCILMAGGFLAGMLDALANSSGANPSDPFGGSPPNPIAIGLMLLGALCMLGSLVIYAILLYKMWAVVQDGRASLSPGAAVALGVIPLVNLVGLFFAFSGLAKEINRVGVGMGSPRPLVSEGLALSSCICYVVGAVGGCIPVLGCLFSPVGLVGVVLRFISMFGMARACEQIALAGGARAAPMMPPPGFGVPPTQRPNPFDPPPMR